MSTAPVGNPHWHALARHRGEASRARARFDAEVDARIWELGACRQCHRLLPARVTAHLADMVGLRTWRGLPVGLGRVRKALAGRRELIGQCRDGRHHIDARRALREDKLK